MSIETLHPWLKGKIRTRKAGCWAGTLLSLVGGVVVLFLTFWFAYAVLWLGERGVSAGWEIAFGKKLHLSHGWRLILCGCFILALLIERFRRYEWDLGQYGPTSGGGMTNALTFQTGAAGGLATIMANPQASSTFITELLYTGPRLVLGALQLGRQARRLAQVDTTACAWVLEYLLASTQAVTHEELSAAWPDGNWPQIYADLRNIPGVVFLEKGLTLTAEFRKELLESQNTSPASAAC